MLSVKTNLLAMNANRQLGINTKKNTKITEKLSSGYKINRAADDAAGLAISEKMRRQIRGLTQGAANIKDGIGYVQTAEGALNEVHDMLQRINELSVKAANGTWTEEDRSYIDSEVQALKKEIDRIFDTTSFNERKIWDYGPGKQEPDVTYNYEKAVTFNGGSSSITDRLTNANCGVLAVSSYKVEADKNGITVKWTGYDGNDYATDLITWDDVEKNGNVYSFKMEDHISDTRLLDTSGNSLIDKTVSFTVNEKALPDQLDQFDRVIESINGATMTSSTGVNMVVHTDDCTNIPNSANGVTIYYPSLNYTAAYASHASQATGSYTFDGANDSFLVPSPSSGNVTVPASGSDKWVFKFNMPGIGLVTASASATYGCPDSYLNKDENIWWYEKTVNGKKQTYTIDHPSTGATLGQVEVGIDEAIENFKKSAAQGGSSSGYIYMTFYLSADKQFSYGDGKTSSSVGSFQLRIDVSKDDTRDKVLKRMEAALNSSTVLDFYNTAASSETATIGGLRKSNGAEDIKIPIYPDDYVDEPYDDTQRFFVQAGAEAGQHIDIEYEFLSLDKIGLKDTNTLTEEDAGNAINEVKAAMTIVSKQRSDFGAYQNRLEHAYNINNNTVENTQAAESLIRDTDIADAMMEYSVNNILQQAGVSMLTQANQLPNSILELLNA